MSEEVVSDKRSDDEKRGITIGILIVALLCLALFFAWHHFGIPGATTPGADRPTQGAPR